MSAETRVKSPCIEVCCLDDQDICIGCYRSLREITLWNSYDDDQRRAVLLDCRARREAAGRTL